MGIQAGKNVEIIYGYHALRHLLSRRSHDVLEVYIAQNKRDSARLDALRSTCNDAQISIQYISSRKLDKLVGENKHQGIAARCRPDSTRQPVTITDLCSRPARECSIILVLDRVMDPHNLGACVRTADAAGVDAIILPKDHAAALNATVKKVASGAAESMHIITVTNLARSLRQLRDAGYRIIGTTGTADKTIYEIDMPFPVVLVMGSEESGLRRNTREHCDRLVKIPMYGSVESLNLSVAAGICLYELRRLSAAGREQHQQDQ